MSQSDAGGGPGEPHSDVGRGLPGATALRFEVSSTGEPLGGTVAVAGLPVHPEDRAGYVESVRQAAMELWRLRWTGRLCSPEGEVVLAAVRASPSPAPGGGVAFEGTVVQLSEERAAWMRDAPLSERLAADSMVAVYDRDLRLLRCEGPLAAGLKLENVIGRHPWEFFGQAAMRVLEPAMRATLAGQTTTVVVEDPGPGYVLAAQLTPARERDGQVVGVVAHWQDLSVQRLLEREHAEALERFRTAFERAPIGMLIMAIDGRVQQANSAFCQLTGYPREQVMTMVPFSLIYEEDRDPVRQRFSQLEVNRGFTTEFRINHAGGQFPWVQASVAVIADDEGRPISALAHLQDISERRSYEHRLRHMADHDPLTGLLNRRGLEPVLTAHLARCRRYGVSGALLVLDVDGFKLVNDTLGHGVGDEVIVCLGQALASRLRESDTIARLGGDEFAVLLPTQSQAQTRVVCQSLLEEIRRCAAELPQTRAGQLTASIGVVMFTDETASTDAILVDADLAMYDAKADGGDRYALYGAVNRAPPKLKAQMAWLERIERALADDAFVLHAQPVGAVLDGRHCWYELLVRMLDDHGRLVPPGAFLQAAERFGVIRQLDRWVVTRAIEAIGAARTQRVSLPLAVNISGISTGDPELLDLIDSELRAREVAPHELTIEVTETSAVLDMSRACRFAGALGEIGCRLALDDFGSGYGSFYYLKHLPFDILKIDGEFIRQAVRNPADRLVIGALTGIARGMGKKTVAEFVEDRATMTLLRAHRVDYAQGFHVGSPVPLSTFMPGAVASPRWAS